MPVVDCRPSSWPVHVPTHSESFSQQFHTHTHAHASFSLFKVLDTFNAIRFGLIDNGYFTILLGGKTNFGWNSYFLGVILSGRGEYWKQLKFSTWFSWGPPKKFETNFSIEFFSISNEGDFVYFVSGFNHYKNWEEELNTGEKKKHVGSHDPQPDFHIRPGCFLCVCVCGEKLSRKVSPPLSTFLFCVTLSPLSFQPFFKKCCTVYNSTRFLNFEFLTGRSLWSSLFHKQFVVTMVTHD